MMIGNLIKCENCGAELQPEDILLNINKEGELIRMCRFCGYKVNVDKEVKK